MTLQAIFFDRDGTLIEETGYLDRIEMTRPLPGAFEAVSRVNQAGFLALVITNQSAVSRGYLSVRQLDGIHAHIRQLFQEQGARLDAFYFCPHLPGTGDERYDCVCDCRKPAPGLIFQASRDFGLSPHRCALIGDKSIDIEAGRRAGCRSVLVQTGYGREQVADNELQLPDHRAEDVLEAVNWLLQGSQASESSKASESSESSE